MSAVWSASRAAVRRRRLQTFVIGVVVLFSAGTVVIALAMLSTSSSPFDRAFDKQSGAHAVATFNGAKVSDDQLAQAAKASPDNAGFAGPFPQAVFAAPADDPVFNPGPVTVVGRPQADGAVDRVNLWAGRWATAPGEIVVNRPTVGLADLGQHYSVPGGPTLTIVGYAYSISGSADAWVSPSQIDALHPNAVQMLYRFTDASSAARIRADMTAATAGLPSDALVDAQSYLVIKQSFAAGPGRIAPVMTVFSFLGLAVAVLIVANVISGAVVSGFRHIGVLKSLGFTPGQVMAVYLLMISIPAAVGTVLGTIAGALMIKPLLGDSFRVLGAGGVGNDYTQDVLGAVGVLAVVSIAALLPALRARTIPAAVAISAGGRQRSVRGLSVQRWLTGARMPRSVSLGLGLPLARPARSVMSLAAVLLGVATVVLATGLSATAVSYGNAVEDSGNNFQVKVRVGGSQPDEPTAPKAADPQIEALLRSLPGAAHVTADAATSARLAGATENIQMDFFRGDFSSLNYVLLAGRAMDGPDQIIAPSGFLHKYGLSVGDRVTLAVGATKAYVTIVGETMSGAAGLISSWDTLTAVAPDLRPQSYDVQLAPGTDQAAYIAAVAKADPGLYASAQPHPVNAGAVKSVSLSSSLTALLATVAALGVFNTVVLNARERRRDLGMLKSIGMTPGQVTAMLVTSMAVLGAIGGLLGLPVGIIAHRLIVPSMYTAAGDDFPHSMLNVWSLYLVAPLLLAGVVIAALGALVPARSAARMTIAEVLRSE